MGEFKRKLEARRALARTLTPGEYALVVGKCPTHRLVNSIPARVLIEQGKEEAERARLKGVADGNCNRTACQAPLKGRPQFTMRNHSVHNGLYHYCAKCEADFSAWDRRCGKPLRCTPVAETMP